MGFLPSLCAFPPYCSAGAFMNIDPITVEVIGSALSSIVEEMGEALIRASFSTNIKERRDCSTALFDTRGTTLCQAEHIPMHLGSFIGIIPEILKRHPVENMQPGDVFIGNDAYAGAGTHLPDIVLGEPIFVDGRIVAWAVNTAHHADFADRGHAHIYQEGLRIPPIRLYRAGELQGDVQELILLNCQVPRERLSDLRAQMAANRLGVQRMRALCSKYGTATVLAVGDALQDYAERKMRAGITALPDGTYRFADTYDNPELGRALDVSVEITIAGDEMRLHFDSPPQVRAGINMIYTALLSSVYYAVKAVVDPTILPNSGLARPISVTAPLGTVMNATHPAAVNGRTSTCQRAADLVIGALAQAAPQRCIAAGNGSCTTASFAGADPTDGHLWVYLETIGGGSGARAGKGRARRCPCPHDQHLQFAGRGARGRIPIDGTALRAGGRLGRRRPVSRRHGIAPGVPRRGRMPPAARRLAPADAPLGSRWRPSRRVRRLPVRRRCRALRRWQRCLAHRRDGRDHHARCRRLWPACRTQSLGRSSATLLINASISPPRRQCILTSGPMG